MSADPAYPPTASENADIFKALLAESDPTADLTLLARCGGAQARVSAAGAVRRLTYRFSR